MTLPSPPPTAGNRRRRLILYVLAAGVLTPLLGGAWFGFWRHHLKRFDVVEPNVLYRVAQPTEFGVKHLVRRYGIRTVLSVRLEDPPLYRGLIDLGEPDGEVESQYVPQLGTRFVQWPIGEETYWPWFTPWLLEEFYRLMDEPANLPVLVHCVGGRHRTGTFVALFQLEYNRRSLEDVLAEMYSYDFGSPAPVHEHNLRTYLPRPLPDEVQWAALIEGLFAEVRPADRPRAYAELVRRIKALPAASAVAQRVADYVAAGQPFALCLAERLIDRPDHPWATIATKQAAIVLETAQDWQTLASAAALIADYGSPAQQRRLLEILTAGVASPVVSAQQAAIVAGVTNRYTPNRIAYLEPLLGDMRRRVEPAAAQYRYCETAAARLISIINAPLYLGEPGQLGWDLAVGRCAAWLADHPNATQLSTLLPPSGKNDVRTGSHTEIDGSNSLR